MKPSAFDYIRVESLPEALSVLADEMLEAKLLAGGQSLLPVLNMRLAQPKTLVDINRLSELASLELGTDQQGPFLAVGSLVRQRVLERFASKEPLTRILHLGITHIGHPQTRNMGTVGGSLAHADPSAELPLLFTTLGGTAFLQSARGERQVRAEEFFQSYFTTAAEPDEMLTKSVWRLPQLRAGVAFQEFRRRHGDFALIAAACTLEIDSRRVIQHVRLGIAGVSDTPLLVQEARELVGARWAQARTRTLAEKVAGQFKLSDDVQASASYRRQLAMVAMKQVLEGAYADAQAKEGTYAAHQG